jgi:hypothetical protein
LNANMAELVHVLRAEECRNSAATLRLLARKTKFPDVRAELLTLAVRFERLADRIEARGTMAATRQTRHPAASS